MKNQNRRPAANPPAANNNQPLLTIERAIADGLCPKSLRQVADANIAAGGARRERQARNLYLIADKLELLGYRSAA